MPSGTKIKILKLQKSCESLIHRRNTEPNQHVPPGWQSPVATVVVEIPDASVDQK